MSPQEAQVPGEPSGSLGLGVCPLRRARSRRYVPSGGPGPRGAPSGGLGPGVCLLRRPGSGGMSPRALNTVCCPAWTVQAHLVLSLLLLWTEARRHESLSVVNCVWKLRSEGHLCPLFWGGVVPSVDRAGTHIYLHTRAGPRVCVCVCVCVCARAHNVSSHQDLCYNSVPWTQYRVDLFFI